MIGTKLMMDEIDYANFFDHIDDLLDFPEDNNHNINVDNNVSVSAPAGNSDSFSTIWPSDVFSSSHQLFSGHSTASDLSAQLAVPYEDIVQMEWLSTFVEDSETFSGGSITTSVDVNQFHSSSPVSVLESSASCSGSKPVRCGRARSKRPRPPTFNPRPAMHLISPAESVAESPTMIKKKKLKVTLPIPAQTMNDQPKEQQQQVSVRKCKHCEITKTPQWRAGPMGPKTLCNACGVRYKSGRLFPEYRPAASPTFVAALHSNSHKKVVEMRIKGSGDTMAFPEPEVILIPNTNPVLLLDYI